MSNSLVHRFLEQQADTRPDATLVVEGDRQATYGEIEAGANRIAQALLFQGVDQGDRIGLVAVNSRQYIEAYYGILKAGGVVVSLNAAGDWRSYVQLLRACQARGVICGDRMGSNAGELAEFRHLEFAIGNDSEWPDRLRNSRRCRLVDWQETVATMRNYRPWIPLQGRDRAAIVFTSGSTGQPKGAVLRHENLVANTQSIVEYLHLTHKDRVMVVLPFHYVYGKSLLNTHVAVGGSVVIENSFLFPQKALNTLEESKATGLSGVPSTFAILLNRSNFAERDFRNLRYVTQAGGAMAPELQRRLIDALPGKRIYIMYGATEASARLAYLSPSDLSRKIGSIGKAIPGVELRVLLEDGTEAARGEVGEIVASGSNLMEGYWNDPKGTAAVLDQNGYHTGDLGHRDEEGFFYVVGRSREMIKSGAHRISPKEIEEILAEHPQVHEAAVLGMPDEMLGEKIVAFVSPRDDQSLTTDEMLLWCKRHLPAHKVPGEIQVVCELRRNASGKVDKLQMAKEYAEPATIPVVSLPVESTIPIPQF